MEWKVLDNFAKLPCAKAEPMGRRTVNKKIERMSVSFFCRNYWSLLQSFLSSIPQRQVQNKSCCLRILSLSLQNSELKQRRRCQRERQKGIRFIKQQLCTCITFFCTDFFADLARTTTQNFLISRFVEDVTTRQEVTACFFSFLSFFLFFLPQTWHSHCLDGPPR